VNAVTDAAIEYPSGSRDLWAGTGRSGRARSAADRKEWREAWVRGDPVALDRVHGDDYLSINYLGQVSCKAQVMSDVRAGAFKYERMEHKDVVVRAYGNVVIVNALTVNKGHRRERDISRDFSYTRVYVKRDGRWQAVLSHYTRPSTP
jgi:hypothetical protein